MRKLNSVLDGKKTVAIAGHVKPDGDCAGSCLAVYNYICDQYPEISVDLYLEPIPDKFLFLKNADRIKTLAEPVQEKVYDLFLALDCGDEKRLGLAAAYFSTAKHTVCVDHHVTNQNFADVNYVFPKASSASELVYELLEEDCITKEIAECIYLGMVHDTGVFQYSCTSSRTMEVAGKLMDHGINYPKIVDETYFVKTYVQNRIMGKALCDSRLFLDGACIYSYLSKADMASCGASSKDLDGIVSTLRSTMGVEVSIFIYQADELHYKISMRSASFVDVASIAASYGGGGHVRAAGATVEKLPEQVLPELIAQIEAQIKEHCQTCTMES